MHRTNQVSEVSNVTCVRPGNMLIGQRGVDGLELLFAKQKIVRWWLGVHCNVTIAVLACKQHRDTRYRHLPGAAFCVTTVGT
jgi:hypothetical protein